MTDRPLECSECKKPIKYHYVEIVGKVARRIEMCESCPVLQHKLSGSTGEKTSLPRVKTDAGLCCGNCGTTLESVRMGHRLGCPECYTIFSNVLIQEIPTAKKTREAHAKQSRRMPLHVGRAPGEAAHINPSMRLLALNEALDETLNREDYEQAALLRDQIKALTENDDEQEKEQDQPDSP